MMDRADTAIACLQSPSPNFGERRDGRAADMLILHYTGMPSADGALKWLCAEESQVSGHYFVFEDGRIVQLVAEAARAWHAGRSCWAGESDINSCSIGIEIAYPGPPDGADFSAAPDFPPDQMEAVAALCRDIVARNAIAPHRILAHSDVAPGRKIDPGDRFPWTWLADNGVGMVVAERPAPGRALLKVGSEGEKVLDLQRRLGRFGYCVPESGCYDGATSLVVTAFQRHFRQELVDGCVDPATNHVLNCLLDRLRGIVAA